MQPNIKSRRLGQARLLAFALFAVALLLSQGCATALQGRNPLPESLLDKVEIAGMPGVRAWADVYNENLNGEIVKPKRPEPRAPEPVPPLVEMLALSGGGGYGAFGAGLLCGWTAAGTRPQFNLVTGISAGALIAPFAFLGPGYDDPLRQVFTTISDKDVFKIRSIFKLVLTLGNQESVADNHPLTELLARYIDARMLTAIAAEHARGRRLLVGTTQLEAQRLVVWDMGAIAASGHPKALDLFRQVLIASATVPVAFPPQYIEVEAEGQSYDEMHVDGGVEAKVMMDEEAMKCLADLKDRHCAFKLYIIQNAPVLPEWEKIKPKLTAIAQRTIASQAKSQGVSDLYRLYGLANRYGVDYNLAYIPENFKASRASQFDKEYMNRLFDLGYNLARAGYDWRKIPPGRKPQ